MVLSTSFAKLTIQRWDINSPTVEDEGLVGRLGG